jgi:hypothetical protein
MKFLVTTIAVLASVLGGQAQTITITGLSVDDVLTIGRGLDKLPREDTDRNRLYDRMQAQITAQINAAAKARADAEKIAIDKAVADALEKAKAEPKQEDTK